MRICKLFKIAAIVVIAALLMTSLAGCSQNEMSLLKALLNTEPIYSYESVGNIEFSFDVVENVKVADNSDGFNGTFFRVLAESFDGAGIAYSMKQDSDKDYNYIKEEMIVTPSLLGGQLKNLTFGMWVDFKSGDPDNSSISIKVPPIYTAISRETAGKDYLTMNFGEVMAQVGEDAGIDVERMFDFSGIMKNVQEVSKPICEGIIKAALLMNPDEVYVGNRRPVVDEQGKMGYVYALKITDAGLKKLLRSIVNDIDKESAKEFLVTMIDNTIKYMESLADVSYVYKDWAKELKKFKVALEDNFDSSYETIKSTLNEALDALNSIRLIGSKGIAVDIGVDSRGFVTKFKGVMDFVVDIDSITKIMGDDPIEVSRVNFSIKFDQNMTRINRNVNIEMPELTKENSYSLIDFFKNLSY
jgi:hypothetical protein